MVGIFCLKRITNNHS